MNSKLAEYLKFPRYSAILFFIIGDLLSTFIGIQWFGNYETNMLMQSFAFNSLYVVVVGLLIKCAIFFGGEWLIIRTTRYPEVWLPFVYGAFAFMGILITWQNIVMILR